MGCPTEATLVEFAEGVLDATAASLVEHHADACGACRRALAELAKTAPSVVTGSVAGASAPRSPPPAAPSALMAALIRVALVPGDVIAARYRIERLLAVGGMGAVYVAQHAETEQRVALKVLLADASASEQAMAGFRMEARVFSRIPGDHVVRVLDAGVDPDRQLGFIVMELL